MIKKISVVLVTVVALLLLYATTKSDTYIVTRNVEIKASPEKIFDQISNLHNWEKWSPWQDSDRDMKKTFSGPEKGKKAALSWDGNVKAGKGSMIIVDETAPFKLLYKVYMEKPIKSDITSDFTLEPKGDITKVTWSSYGSRNYFAKIISIFFDCEKMTGKNFEDGLAKLKKVTEEK